MIFSVSVSDPNRPNSQDAEILEWSWHNSGQQGELVRLVPSAPSDPLPPKHLLCSAQSTLDWERHPYLDDIYSGYNLPGAVFQWLLQQKTAATILLLDPDTVFATPLNKEVSVGGAVAQQWLKCPSGEGPFGLPSSCIPLRAYCVNRELTLPKIQLPLLIHSSDLLMIAPRWLELVGLIRSSVLDDERVRQEAALIALNIAAAEYCVRPEPADLSEACVNPDLDAEVHRAIAGEYESSICAGEHLAALWPRRLSGIRQAVVCDQWYLELGSPLGMVSMNRSAGAVWKLCDGSLSLLEVVRSLQNEYELPPEAIMPDIVQTVAALKAKGAITIDVKG